MYVFIYTQGLCEHCNCKRVCAALKVDGGGGGLHHCYIAPSFKV